LKVRYGPGKTGLGAHLRLIAEVALVEGTGSVGAARLDGGAVEAWHARARSWKSS
jgi:hypothetical protein